ncbi:ABC transporter substrate-binding protein [Rhizobium sp. PAMB 3174]
MSRLSAVFSRLSRAAGVCCLVMTSASAAGAADTDFPAMSGNPSQTLVIASITDLQAFRPLIEGFQKHHPDIAIDYNETTSEYLDAAMASACKQKQFAADLVISSSIAAQVQQVNNGCAQKISGTAAASLPDFAKWRGELVGVTFEPAVIVYNKAGIVPAEVPQDRFSLIDLLRDPGRFEGRIGTYDIERSGVGYIFAFEDALQASTWGRLIESFGRNRAKTFCCTSEILDRVADGRLLFGYNVLGSYALARQKTDDRIGIIFPSDYTLVLARAAYIPREARAAGVASLFLDYLVSSEGRALLAGPPQLFSPVDGPAVLSQLTSDGEQTLRTIGLNPTLLVALDKQKKKSFIQQWRQSLAPR